MQKERLRYAPSPTGFLHIGGARTALINYLWAKHYQGTFIVRIEDTDIARNIKDGERSQLENLRWLGIEIDETVDVKDAKYGPYRQSDRIEIYNKYINQLLEEGNAYRCFCSPEVLNQIKEAQIKAGIYAPKYQKTCRNLNKNIVEEKLANNAEHVIRVKNNPDITFAWNDLVRGEVSFNSNDIDDFVILKSNKIPTYNLGVVIDDHLMDITVAIRGEEHISNTPKQLLLFSLLKWTAPKFAHLTIITNHDGKKLSKRDLSLHQFIEDYRNEGYLPEAVFNFLALLGWNPADNSEINTKADLIKKFDEKRLSKSPSIFDIKKMQWINSVYIKKLDFEVYKNLTLPFLKEAYDLSNYSSEWSDLLISIYQKQLSYGKEIVDLTKIFFTETDFKNDSEIDEVFNNDSAKLLIKEFKNGLNNLEVWSVDNIKLLIKQLQKELSIKGKALFMPLRIAASFSMHGPELAKTIYLLSKKNVVKNITSVEQFYDK